MTAPLSKTVAAYIMATNDYDAPAFMNLFDDDAVVNDVGREIRGTDAIKAWSDREIFDAQVSLELLDVDEHDREVTITTKVDGNFDRTGLPDPDIISRHFTVEGDKIVGLTCRLANPTSPGPRYRRFRVTR